MRLPMASPRSSPTSGRCSRRPRRSPPARACRPRRRARLRVPLRPAGLPRAAAPRGRGAWLIDPIAVPDLSPSPRRSARAEWILHAATQDLPCLAEVGLRPRQLFDTELAGRLLGLPRVGPGRRGRALPRALARQGHSAVDWSTAAAEPWLRYAALGVEVLVELRNLRRVDLARQGKAAWAARSSRPCWSHRPGAAGRPLAAHVGHAPGAPPPRRRRPGAVGDPRRRRPPRPRHLPRALMPDAVLMELAVAAAKRPTSRGRTAPLPALPAASGSTRSGALAVPDSDLPPLTLRSDGPPPPRAWATATRSRPSAWPPLAPSSPRSPRSRSSRSRTSCRRTRSPGSSGHRKAAAAPPGSPRRSWPSAAGTSRSASWRRWSAAFAAHPTPTPHLRAGARAGTRGGRPAAGTADARWRNAPGSTSPADSGAPSPRAPSVRAVTDK